MAIPENPKPGSTEDQARSLYAVRRTIGLLGLSLPLLFLAYWALFVRPDAMPGSISAFYHTPMGDVLVGGLSAVGLFLISYLGYSPSTGQSKVLTDFWVSTLAGVGALGVALLPTGASETQCAPGTVYTLAEGASPPTIRCAEQGFIGHPEWIHFASAALFFLAISIMCLLLFPRDETGRHFRTSEHKFYALCGGILIVVGAGMLVVSSQNTPSGTWIFWLEAIGVMTFSLAWLVKGRLRRGVKAVLPSHQ